MLFRSDGEWVNDRHLKRALRSLDASQEMRSIRASRPGRSGAGEYLLIPHAVFDGVPPETRGPLTIEGPER